MLAMLRWNPAPAAGVKAEDRDTQQNGAARAVAGKQMTHDSQGKFMPRIIWICTYIPLSKLQCLFDTDVLIAAGVKKEDETVPTVASVSHTQAKAADEDEWEDV